MKKHINIIRTNGFNCESMQEGQSFDLLSLTLKSQEHYQRFSYLNSETAENEISQKSTKNEENES